jgi:hypothetical protein
MENDPILKITETLEKTQQVLNQLALDTSAMYAVIRALADANAANPVFAASLKKQIEHRITGQLNSAMTDQQIATFKESVRYLIPKELRVDLI